MSAGCTNRNFGRSEKDHAAQRGRDACGTATRISASLSRRLFVSFRSASDQDPKAAKFAVLIPDPGIFVNVQYAPRVVIAAPSGRPLFRRVGRLCEKLKNALKSGLEQRCNSNFLAIFVEVILWFFDRLRKAPALLAPEPSLSLTSQVQRKF